MSVLIISKNADFAQSLAEQVRSELALDCHVAGNVHDASVVVTTEPDLAVSCPVIEIKNRPVRMRAILEDIEKYTSSQVLNLGGGYQLNLRAKQLTQGAKTVDLTDKEAQLVQCLSKGTIARDQLLKTVWGIESALDTHTLETHIYRLRGKCRELNGDELIEATEGGYRLKL